MSNIHKYLLSAFMGVGIVSLFGGCTPQRVAIPVKDSTPKKQQIDDQTVVLRDSIREIADELLNKNTIKKTHDMPIAFTSFVNLNNFSKSSNFGRLMSETLMSEMIRRGAKVSDFRGQNAITVRKRNGEFFLSRNASLLKSKVQNTYVLVGTYTTYGKDIILNVRIMDNNSGLVLSSASVIIRDPLLFKEMNAQNMRVVQIKKDICDKSTPCD